ncbi:MAG: hypothetical protein U9Q72_00435 [Patescibacteria group bacterium]|nr:hypothetical protein [Patescibacteria group bacterium]
MKERERNFASAQNLFLDPETNPSEDAWIRFFDERVRVEEKAIARDCKRGEIWKTSTKILDNQGIIIGTVPVSSPVLIWSEVKVNSNQMVRIMPLSLDTDFVSWPGSILTSAIQNITWLVEIFNERPIFSWSLEKYLGAVSLEDLRRVQKARNEFFGGGGLSLLDHIQREWERIELKMAEHLSLPVNLAL